MSALAKGLAVSTVAFGTLAFGAGHGWAQPQWQDHGTKNHGNYYQDKEHWDKKYEQSRSYFKNVKQEEKNSKHANFHYAASDSEWDKDKDCDYDRKHNSKQNDHKYSKWYDDNCYEDKHVNKGRHNQTQTHFAASEQDYKKVEKTEAAHEKEAYAASYSREHDAFNAGHKDYGYGDKKDYRKHDGDKKDFGGTHVAAASSNVQASVAASKEASRVETFKAEEASAKTVAASHSDQSYGNKGYGDKGYNHGTEASTYVNATDYSKVEAAVAESQKVSYNANFSAANNAANFDSGYHGANAAVASNAVNYSVSYSQEYSRVETLKVEQASSYTAAANVSSHDSSYGNGHDKGYGHNDQHQGHDWQKEAPCDTEWQKQECPPVHNDCEEQNSCPPVHVN